MVSNMLIGKYLVSFRQAIERLDDYGFAESIIYKEERRAGKQVIDNAAHKPALNSKNHRHTENGEIELIDPPEIQMLIDEVIRCL